MIPSADTQLRHDHLDSHCCVAQLKYICLVMDDDTHFINVGEPGLPVASLGRERRMMVTGSAESRPTAVNHGFCLLRVTPSVTLVPAIREVSLESFY